MQPYQRAFLELALNRHALRFGDFTLKSGRVSPYFFNAGMFNSGGDLAALGHAYAQCALASNISFDMLFGPAYKGIPLATATAIALAGTPRGSIPVAFNRKEAKAHGEGGVVIGAPLQGNVLIVDDVITAGTAIRESLSLIAAQGARAAGILIALDRQERGQGTRSAVQEIEAELGIPVIAIARLQELLTLTGERAELLSHRDRLDAYTKSYAA